MFKTGLYRFILYVQSFTTVHQERWNPDSPWDCGTIAKAQGDITSPDIRSYAYIRIAVPRTGEGQRFVLFWHIGAGTVLVRVKVAMSGPLWYGMAQDGIESHVLKLPWSQTTCKCTL